MSKKIKSVLLSEVFSEKSEVIILCEKVDLESIVSESVSEYKGTYQRDNSKNAISIKTNQNTIHFLNKADWNITINEKTNS